MKRCNSCKELKNVSEFGVDKNIKSGYSGTCKKCKNNKNKLRRRSKEGLITKMYFSQIYNSKKKGRELPGYSLNEIKEWVYSNKEFSKLYDNWVDSGYDKLLIPSIDRIDDNKSYEFGNIQLITWKENWDKSFISIKSGKNKRTLKAVHSYSITGDFIRSYYSISEAARQLSVNSSLICMAAKGRIKTACNMQWRYEKLDKINPIKNGLILQYSLYGALIGTYKSALEAQRKTGVHCSNIGRVCNGKAKTSGGFVWKYYDGEDLTDTTENKIKNIMKLIEEKIDMKLIEEEIKKALTLNH